MLAQDGRPAAPKRLSMIRASQVALLAFLVLVLLPVALLFKIPVLKFMDAVSKPASIAFLPSAMASS